ncbi:MAG: YgaP-like transmembrane domain [Verrucomicrobium sp.]|nr:YgaP-like transmembrane domain [Verrucomicrobium sp.]
MSLTYQPFATIPEVLELGKQLNKNVGEGERLLSIAGSTALYLLAGQSTGIKSLALYAGAAALFTRGLSGHCPLYYHTGATTSVGRE